MEIQGFPGVNLTMSGTGTVADPIIYTWDTGENATLEEPGPGVGDVKYTVTFRFSEDGGGSWLDYTYTATYIEIAQGNDEPTPDEDQQELDAEYQDTPIFIILGEKEFLPLQGGIIHIKLRDPLGGKRSVAVNIPPIPLSYLYIDDYPDANNNLAYNNGTDRYDIPNAPLTNVIAPTDILKVKVKYYTFGPRTLANGATLSFMVSRSADPNKVGLPVRYNPIPSGSVARDPNAPKINLPLLLNPQSRVFDRFQRLSLAKGSLRVLVSERGDGKAFPGLHVETLPFTVQDDGLMLIQVHHLTTFGVQEAVVSDGGGGGGGGGGCFIDTAANYEKSPHIADFIADHDAIRAMVRWSLAPVVGLSWVALNHGTLAALVMLFMVLVSGSGVMLYRRRKS
jgi:hypothetical protein